MLKKLALTLSLACSLLWCLGWASNVLVEYANDGLMPVRTEICQDYAGIPVRFDAIHACEIPSTHLRWLDDWIDMGNTVASPGDFAIETARFCALFASLSLIGFGITRLDKKS
jgi:hypothetical protein